nr:reverse transcriptase domain-containing protein [Tanacetum cinerariifolium]
MDKVRRDKRKEFHARLDFGEDSHHSSARSRTTKPERLKVRDRLRYGDRHVLDRLVIEGRGRSHPRRLDTSNEDCPEDRECFRGIGESYDDSYSHPYRDENPSRHMKRGRDNESLLSSVSKSDSSDGRYRKSKSKRHKPTDEDDLTRSWMYEEEDPFTPRIRNFESSRRTRMPNNVKTYDGTGDPEDHVKIFQAAAQVERWAMPTWCHMFNSTLIGATRNYVKDLVEINNIKQKDGETIEDFMERFKVETVCMKGGPECMRISGFMHGVNNPELTKRLNEHVPKTMEKMMIATTAFIRGEAPVASKKKGHTSWRAQDQSKRKTLQKRSNFRGHLTEGMGSSRFTPLTRTPKEILATEAGKFQPSPPMVTPVEKRSSNKFCDFQNDKGHSTNESSSGVEGPLVIEAEMGGYMIHRKYVDEGDADHSTRAWMNFMIVRSLSPYNGIVGRPEIREIQAVPSTAHEMLKFPVEGGIVTIRSTILIHAECTSVITSSAVPKEEGTRPENFKVALHPDFPDQEVAIRGTSEQAFKQLKQHLSELPLLVAPKPKEELIVYLSATYGAISTVLMTKRGANQTPIYFISHALQGPKLNYTPMEKLVLSLVFAAKRLRRPRKSVKGQILADFLTEMPDENPPAAPVGETQQVSWTLFTDGSSCVDGSSAGLILISPEGTKFTYALRFQFAASNNEAEYEALIAGLRIAAQMGVQNVHVSVDSIFGSQSCSRDVCRQRGKHDQAPGQSQKLGHRIYQLFHKPSTTK